MLPRRVLKFGFRMPEKMWPDIKRCFAVCCCGLALMLAGCNTLASLGLPVGTSSNKLLESAKAISNAQSRSIALPTELAEQPTHELTISVGDTLLVEPVSFDSTIRLAGDQIVKPNGTISLGEFGEYPVVGKSVEQLKPEIQALIAAQLRERLQTERANKIAATKRLEAIRSTRDDEDGDADDRLKDDELESQRVAKQEAEFEFEQAVEKTIAQNRISVRVVNMASQRFYVLGEVNSPGFYSYTGTEDVLFAITEAGGLTSKADSHQIVLVRPTACGSCKIVLRTCYQQIVQLGDTSTNYQILPGDRVFVPALTFCDDLKRSLGGAKHDRCPRCADCPESCCLPEGCPDSSELSPSVAVGSHPQEEVISIAEPAADNVSVIQAIPSEVVAPPQPTLEP